MAGNMTVLVTGASGFVGGAVLATGRARGFVMRPVYRNGAVVPDGANHVAIIQPVQDATTDWSAALHGVDAVVHCAARAHQIAETEADPAAAFRSVNVDGTLNLARQAAAAGVGRFVFISTIKVNGEGTTRGQPFLADDRPAPGDAYARSKADAETGLRELARQTGIELTIIRPVLVYGPGAKANFLTLMRWIGSGVPLPLGAVQGNRRSLLALDNLVDLILTCISHPAAAGETFLASDGEDVSTAELVRRLAAAMGRPARLLPVPVWALRVLASLLGRREVARRLYGSLQVDITKTRTVLGWAPPVPMDEALRRAAGRGG